MHKIHPKSNKDLKEENWLLNFHKLPTVSGVLTHTPACKAAMKEEDINSTIWDSGASMNATFDREDFTGPIESLPKGSVIEGMSNGLEIEGFGQVMWSLKDSQGNLRDSQLP